MADVFRDYEDSFVRKYSTSVEQHRVFQDIADCRTAALGGHVKKCDHCDHKEIFYNSCGNRHCPKCQSKSSAHWLEAQAENLLEVEYYKFIQVLPSQTLFAICQMTQQGSGG